MSVTIDAQTPSDAYTTVNSFKVATSDFGGPMDLLVYLVRRRELDVAYISVSAIISDYLDWIDRAELPDLDNAGDFILLAAILIQFKVVNLLPGSEPERAEVELQNSDRDDTPYELMSLRKTINRLAELEANQINLFNRGLVQISGLQEELTGELLSDVSVYDLALAFRDLIYDRPPEPTHLVEEIPYTLEGQMAFILSIFGQSNRLAFTKLASRLNTRLAIIMTFLAMLELIRLNRILVAQDGPFGPLWLIRRTNMEDGRLQP